MRKSVGGNFSKLPVEDPETGDVLAVIETPRGSRNKYHRLRERRAMQQQDLCAALAQDELALNYQPRALIGGEVTGFEALVRWETSARGVVMPDKFIPIADFDG
jgi:predicted signal transduction protein with EAL and GGDEF domain